MEVLADLIHVCRAADTAKVTERKVTIQTNYKLMTMIFGVKKASSFHIDVLNHCKAFINTLKFL